MKSGTRRNSERKKRNKIPEEFFTFYFFLSCAPLLLLFRVGLGFFIVFIDPRQTVYNDGTMTKRLLFRLLGNGPIFSLKLILFSNQMNRLEANNNNHVLFNLIDFILPFHWIFVFFKTWIRSEWSEEASLQGESDQKCVGWTPNDSTENVYLLFFHCLWKY